MNEDPFLYRRFRLELFPREAPQLLDNGEPEAESPMLTGERSIGLPEAIEDIGHEFGRNAHARISYPNLQKKVRLPDGDIDLSSAWRKFYRIGQKVPEDLLEAIRVAR